MIRFSLQDGGTRQAVAVDAAVARIGRTPECEIRLPSDPTVSRVHAVVEVMPEGLVLRDAGSRNGTFLNGEPVAGPAVLAPADRVRVGPFVLVVQDEDDAYVETADAAQQGAERLHALTGLSGREVDVLRLLAAGRSDQEIAERLVISVKTVHSHLDRIRGKTSCRRRPELIRYAIDHGIA